MPEFKAPNHDDCAIVCPDGGYAIYIEPYGPCVTGCTPAELEKSIFAIIGEKDADFESSGVIYRMHTEEVASAFRNVALTLPIESMLLRTAQALQLSRQKSLSMMWSKTKLDQAFGEKSGQRSND